MDEAPMQFTEVKIRFVFQWDHSLVAVDEDNAVAVKDAARNLLQWGHSLVAVDEVATRLGHAVAVEASMGPQLGSRG